MPDGVPVPDIGALNNVFHVICERTGRNIYVKMTRHELETYAHDYVSVILGCLMRYQQDRLIDCTRDETSIKPSYKPEDYDEFHITSEGAKNCTPY
jgi:hypothetical protein